MIKVFKFGGASVQDAEGIRNVCSIIRNARERNHKLVVVVSAMGDTTDDLVELANVVSDRSQRENQLRKIRNAHTATAVTLFPKGHFIFAALNRLFRDLDKKLREEKPVPGLRDYILSHGEILSTLMVNHYLTEYKIASVWADARELIVTDAGFGNASVHWPATQHRCQTILNLFDQIEVVVTQGFIGRSQAGAVTTLGREGSDFSAAIFACCLGATSVTLWKDVPGLMNADPRILQSARVLEELPYAEAAEMMYYGANLIHTKTITPLAAHDIPLYVKSFLQPGEPGTRIYHSAVKNLPPMYVVKKKQTLLTCRAKDFGFMSGNHLLEIFSVLDHIRLPHNLIQHSALTFSCCFDHDEPLFNLALTMLSDKFEVHYNLGLTLITIKNYTPELAGQYRTNGTILMEQCSRSTLQILVNGDYRMIG